MLNIILPFIVGVLAYLILRTFWLWTYPLAHSAAATFVGTTPHRDLLATVVIPELPEYTPRVTWKTPVLPQEPTPLKDVSLETYRLSLLHSLGNRWPAIPQKVLAAIVDSLENILAVPANDSEWSRILLKGIAHILSVDSGLPIDIGQNLVMASDIESTSGLGQASSRIAAVASVWKDYPEYPHDLFSLVAAVLLVRNRPMSAIPQYMAAVANYAHKDMQDPRLLQVLRSLAGDPQEWQVLALRAGDCH